MDGNQRLGPTPGSLRMQGMGGPGGGFITMPRRPGSPGTWADQMALWQAGGYGMGPYGYPLAFGVRLAGEQNLLLNRQWGWPGVGTHDFRIRGGPDHRHYDTWRD